MAIGAKLRYEVLRRDRYTCRFCGSSAPDVQIVVDHVIPRMHGGEDVASNLQALCFECNAGKSATMPERWLVKEIRESARRGPWPAAVPADDLSEMFIYLDARFDLEELPSADVLALIMRVMADVFPYRPDGSQLVIAAAKAARERPTSGMPA